MITANRPSPAISDPAIGAVSNDGRGEHEHDATLARVFSDPIINFSLVRLVGLTADETEAHGPSPPL